ncbi:MAG: MBL fold metallo-hydrolase [Thermoplasmata archaeon]|nr:MBL fold metallo-hydrolase [Thermoplasmata archaeon]
MSVIITILYDNYTKDPRFRTGWGFSAAVEVEKGKILFDTGWDGEALLHNMELLGYSPKDFDMVFLSHNHWDHAGGLPHVLRMLRKDAVVYLPTSFSKRFRDEIRRRNPAEIVEEAQELPQFGVYTTGSLDSEVIAEQSMVVPLEEKNGNLVVVGCSHPGVDRIVRAAERFGPVYGILGGLHGFSDIPFFSRLEFIAPLHCTRYKREIQRAYPNRTYIRGVGEEFRF